MADLVVLTDVKAYLFPGETITTWDTMLAVIISAVSEAVRKEVGCDIVHTHYTAEKVSGTGKSNLDLPHWPITAVSSIVDQEGNVYVVGYSNDYVIEYFCLRSMGGTWAAGSRNFTISFEAGLATLPADLILLCYEVIARKWKTAKESGWGESSKSFPDGSVSHVNADGEFTKAQLRVLEKYRRPRL